MPEGVVNINSNNLVTCLLAVSSTGIPSQGRQVFRLAFPQSFDYLAAK